jgi:hypothetical protein
LRHHVPTRPAHGRRDELGTDIAFAETAFVDAAIQNWPLPLTGSRWACG